MVSISTIAEGVKRMIPSILIVMIVVSFALSVVSLSRSGRNQKAIAQIQRDVASMSFEICNRLDAMDAHISVIEKYAVDTYGWFYGVDRVTINTNNKDKKVITNKK